MSGAVAESRGILLVSAAPGSRGADVLAAGLATCAADERRAALLVEAGATARPRRPTLLASPAARDSEGTLRKAGHEAAARGLICHLAAGDGAEGLDRVAEAQALLPPSWPCVVGVEPGLWLAALDRPDLRVRAAVLRVELPRDAALSALAVRDLRRRGIGVRLAHQQIGWAAGRRALSGVAMGGAAEARLRRWAAILLGSGAGVDRCGTGLAGRLHAAGGQVLPAVLGAVAVLLLAALAMVSIAGALTGKGRLQRAADLAALSAARSMRDDMARVTAPPRLPDGVPNPAHLARAAYLERARTAALQAAGANGADPRRVRVAFPDAASFPPLRVKVAIAGELPWPGHSAVSAWAVAEAAPGAGGYADLPAQASGGGYSGPLEYRNGEGMRPDVAAAYDRMAAAARRAGMTLVVVSGFRSDAEQAQLFAQHPDPKWVAPPGQSLHRCATELDLGPSSAYGWLYANSRRFGFLKRYSWEPWHFGFVAGPPPCSATTESGGLAAGGAGEGGPSQTLPAFVPARFRDPLLRSAARWNVSAALLAAQLMAESGFDPYAVSAAGAQGIAQFMPGTAASFGLRDPFDPEAAIDAQAHMMSALLRQFGSVRLALAAYNAGSGAVAACHCVPGYPETIAYVARILALLDGAGVLLSPPFEVRLVA